MKPGYNIAWSEGTYLTQQHFQYWDASIHDAQARILQITVPYAYGLTECILDTSLLSHGICRVQRLRWVTQTGEVFFYDSSSMPPLQCTLIPQESQYIYVQHGGNGCEGLSGYQDEPGHAKYQVSYHAVSDQYDRSKTQELALKRCNLALKASKTLAPGCASLAIAAVRHRAGNHYELETTFIPASLNLGTCDGLRNFIEKIIQNISEKLCAFQKQLERKCEEKSYIDAMQWSHCWVELNAMKKHGGAHPYQIYMILSKLIHSSALLKSKRIRFQDYDHEHLTDVFCQMGIILKEMLTIEQLPEEESITLMRIDELHHTTGQVSLSIIQACDWYLGVNIDSDDLTWIKQFVQQAKLCPAEKLSGVLVSALPGIGLQHVQHPPASVRLRSGYEYFRLKKHDSYWGSLETHHNLTVYLPKPFHTAALSLDIVKE